MVVCVGSGRAVEVYRAYEGRMGAYKGHLGWGWGLWGGMSGRGTQGCEVSERGPVGLELWV